MATRFALLVALAATAPTSAQMSGCRTAPSNTDDPIVAAARQFQQVRRKGKQTRMAIRRVTKELAWHRSLKKVGAAARASGKPIVWIQMLGKLTGFA